jgi:hypothetical protein
MAIADPQYLDSTELRYRYQRKVFNRPRRVDVSVHVMRLKH